MVLIVSRYCLYCDIADLLGLVFAVDIHILAAENHSLICLLDQVFQISNDDGLTVAQLLAKFNKENGSDVKIVKYERFLAGA